MFIKKSEKKGIITLGILITALFVLPQTIRRNECPVFLITRVEHTDTLPVHSTRANALPPIELNTADSATLIAIRGIGPYYANKILRYRQQLGGYYSPLQLKEIKFQYLDIDSLILQFTANPALIRKRELDTMSFKAILLHPYLQYEEVQLIFNAKRKFGKINYSILESEKILPLSKLKKIKPYFK